MFEGKGYRIKVVLYLSLEIKEIEKKKLEKIAKKKKNKLESYNTTQH